jgi:hypothetical protein
MNYNTFCSTGWRVNATYHHLLELYMAEQAKGHIFLAKEDYLKSERFVMVGDFELTRYLYSTMVNDFGGIYYPGMVVLPWDFEKKLEPWETGDNPIILDPEVIEIDDSESKEDGSISNGR